MWQSGYESAINLLCNELMQLREEGFLVPESLIARAANMTCNSPDEDFRNVYDQLKSLPANPDFHFVEPDSLDDIRKLRPAERMKKTPLPYDSDELGNRYLGAWTGRCTGCALGKPVENLGLNKKHHAIRDYLKQRDDWPLKDFFAFSKELSCPKSTRENIAFMESDDDIRYTLIGLLIFEKYGSDFTSAQIARLWHETLTLKQACTAERQALLNFALFFNPLPDICFNPDFTSSFNNPYREWIGAQIRADFFGFMAPGDPQRAAEFAWRDASWTHRKNGIYGEMFIAAMEAAAFVTHDPHELINAGLGEIPENCRLAFEIREATKACRNYRNMDEFMQYADERFPNMSPVHTINNAVICTAALIYGNMNPDRSICEAVTAGLDTDCNGATVGAITGIAAGGRDFGGSLAPRLNNLVKSEMPAIGDITITELADRTLKRFLTLTK